LQASTLRRGHSLLLPTWVLAAVHAAVTLPLQPSPANPHADASVLRRTGEVMLGDLFREGFDITVRLPGPWHSEL